MIVTWIARLVASLNANRRPGEIAAGIAMGVMLALIPAGNLLWLGLLILTVFLKVNLGIELLVLVVLRPFAPLADGVLHTVGAAVLTSEGLYPFFAGLYTVPLVAFTRFNNTVVMGALLAGLVLWLPLFFLGRVLVVVYRKKIHPRLAESRIVKAFQRVPIVSKVMAVAKRFHRIYSIVG